MVAPYFMHLVAECKRTPKGIEYLGTTNTTLDGEQCQHWAKMNSTIFPYGSHDTNSNYCRSATRPGHQKLNFMDTPWCYNIQGTPSPCNITYCGKSLLPVALTFEVVACIPCITARECCKHVYKQNNNTKTFEMGNGPTCNRKVLFPNRCTTL